MRYSVLGARPSAVLAAYAALIVIYACLYWIIPGAAADDSGRLSFLKSLYFSVVTITTLGYGDVTPVSNIGMLLVSSQAVFGIVTIGLFLNALWHSFAKRLERAQDKAVQQRLDEANLRKLASYYRYLRTSLVDYRTALAELITPIGRRRMGLVAKPSFKFSDLQYMYSTSAQFRSGFTASVLRTYFEKQDSLVAELKYFLSNFDLSKLPSAHEKIIDFLAFANRWDIRKPLLEYESQAVSDRLAKDVVVDLIKEHDECPTSEAYRSHLLTPVIQFYQYLQHQILASQAIFYELDNLVGGEVGRGQERAGSE